MRRTKFSVLVIVALLMIGCKTNSKPEDKFSYNFQFYNYENNQVDEKGETDLENIIEEFNSFPWIEQAKKVNSPEAKSTPNIGLKDHQNNYDFGITAAEFDGK